MSTGDGTESKSKGSANTVPIVVAIITALATIIVAFKDPITAILFPTPTPIPPAQVTQPALPPVAIESAPALQFEPCTSDTSCLNYVQIREIVGNPEPFAIDTEYSAEISSDSQIQFQSGWCAKDQRWLDDNLPHIQFFFAINGVSYRDQLGAEHYTGADSEYPSCYRASVGVSNWQSGVVYRISIGQIRDADLFDGGTTAPKGQSFRTFVLTVK